MDLGEIVWDGVNLIHLGHGGDWWQAFLNMIIFLWVSQKLGIS
jgi:hypothetical protein